MYIGEICAFACAIAWAFAVILFKKSGEKVHPVALNLFKNTFAFILIIPTLYIFGETLYLPVPAEDYLLLIISGAIGIGIADTLLFFALNRLGAGLNAIVACSYSPSMVILSMIFLDERLKLLQLFGIALILSAILFATKPKKDSKITKRDIIVGFILGIAANILMAVGIVMIKPLLNRSPLLWATEFRIIGGILFLVLFMAFYPARGKIIKSLIKTHSWGYTISSSFIGAYVAMLLWFAGMKYTKLSIASALNQTSNIFVFIFAALLLHEKLTLRRVIAMIAAIGGVLFVVLG